MKNFYMQAFDDPPAEDTPPWMPAEDTPAEDTPAEDTPAPPAPPAPPAGDKLPVWYKDPYIIAASAMVVLAIVLLGVYAYGTNKKYNF